MSNIWEVLDNWGHAIRLPKEFQTLLCERVDNYYMKD